MSRAHIISNEDNEASSPPLSVSPSTTRSIQSSLVNINVRPVANQQTAINMLMESLISRPSGTNPLDVNQRQQSIANQYRLQQQHLQQQWRGQLSQQGQPPQTHNNNTLSSASNCPKFLEGQNVFIDDCAFLELHKGDVYKAVQVLGGKLLKTFNNDCTLFVTPYQMGPNFERATLNVPQTRIVSLQWLEECIQTKQYMDPYKPCIHYPLVSSMGISNMSKLVISVTGFIGEERNDLKFLIKASGARYSGALSKKENTHLICCVPEGEKYQRALEWNILVINKRWLYDCVSEWNCCPEQYYSDINIYR
ncbi:PAX-interacting protein [Acrasis kona]|uniref:PAX-interacting protein n=1 Tax=Acrasis kona TaxID=1008807 RepID=A0AAW2Z7Y1_9EUKA